MRWKAIGYELSFLEIASSVAERESALGIRVPLEAYQKIRWDVAELACELQRDGEAVLRDQVDFELGSLWLGSGEYAEDLLEDAGVVMAWAEKFYEELEKRHAEEVEWAKAYRTSTEPNKEKESAKIVARTMARYEKEGARREAVLDALGKKV